jgi:hypothetical protein
MAAITAIAGYRKEEQIDYLESHMEGENDDGDESSTLKQKLKH